MISRRADSSDRPSSTFALRAAWAGLPGLPSLEQKTRTASLSVITSVDRDGRLADRSAMSVMRWSPGQAVGFSIEPGPIVVAEPEGSDRLNGRGHLRLPALIRRQCHIEIGSRVLVVPNPVKAEVLVLPVWVLDDMLNNQRAAPPTGQKAK